MKIILASKEKFLLNKGYDLLGISREELKIGFVNTALQVVMDQEYLKYMNEYFDAMALSGIDFKQFDIEEKTEKEILDFFADRNVIQVSGGNPFYLLKNIREVGFDSILKKLLEAGLFYIGCSSGSYIMCPTIEVGSWKLDRNRYGLNDFTALNYVPFLIKCHFTDNFKEEMIEKAKTLKYPLKVLRDDQCFYIENGEISFFGDSEEVVL
ncbi:MAG: Type 1 glutamine amidotransferase-like domain-containing protein [Patescibacteria group bacterium]|nr:Type 1 glutamine amidotransferase-like domain-containing protein [Patescibacteria group bacterium]